MNQQIEKMARDIGNSRNGCFQDDCLNCRAYGQCMYQEIATDLYNMDYRKQIVGEWEKVRYINGCIAPYQHTCSVCKKSYFDVWAKNRYPFCPNCGARMSGGKNE